MSAHHPQEPALQELYPQYRPVDRLPSREKWKRKVIQGSRFTLVTEAFSLLSTHLPLHWDGRKGWQKQWRLNDVCTFGIPQLDQDLELFFWTSTLTYFAVFNCFVESSPRYLTEAGWRGFRILLSKGSNQLRFWRSVSIQIVDLYSRPWTLKLYIMVNWPSTGQTQALSDIRIKHPRNFSLEVLVSYPSPCVTLVAAHSHSHFHVKTVFGAIVGFLKVVCRVS